MSVDVAEAEELRRRLHEAEDTLRAIRDGEVDALVVRGPKADQIFHLGDNESYRAFMEAMELGAAALDEQSRLLYANSALCGLLGVTFEALQESGLVQAMGASAGGALAALVRDSAEARATAELALPARGGRRHVLVTAAPLSLGFSTGRALTFTDMTERIDAAAAEESQRVGRAILGSSADAVVVCDARGHITQANPAALGLLEGSPIGRDFDEVFDFAFTPGAGIVTPGDIVAVTLSGGSVRNVEATLPSARGSRDLLISTAPLRYAGGAIGGCIVTLLDLTDRKALEKRQSLLMRELDHRMKNMLTLVASISARTMATSAGLTDFKERFSQRLSALAATQDLLATRAWEDLLLEDLIRSEIAPFVPTASARVGLERLGVRVSREAAVALGLVFHELVTNAVKYGALSVEAGRVLVSATPRADGGLEVVWREEGGPPVEPLSRRGFGQTVISRGLGASAAEPTRMEYRPEGVVCTLTLAPSAVVGA
jgi:PAS domain S-box-containing protein